MSLRICENKNKKRLIINNLVFVNCYTNTQQSNGYYLFYRISYGYTFLNRPTINNELALVPPILHCARSVPILINFIINLKFDIQALL